MDCRLSRAWPTRTPTCTASTGQLATMPLRLRRNRDTRALRTRSTTLARLMHRQLPHSRESCRFLVRCSRKTTDAARVRRISQQRRSTLLRGPWRMTIRPTDCGAWATPARSARWRGPPTRERQSLRWPHRRRHARATCHRESAMPYKDRICGIYAVTHVKSGRKYIGKSAHVKNRWCQHLCDCRDHNNRFYNALAKYGKSAFTWEIIEECSGEVLNEREQFWISHFDTVKTGFNLTQGGDGVPAGFKHSTKERVAKSIRQKGKPHSAEHNRKVSESLTGRTVSDHMIEHLRGMAEKRRGMAVIFSEQHRKNISESKLGKSMPIGALAKSWETRRSKQ